MLLLEVTTAFDKALKRLHPERSDIADFLVNHERKGMCLDRLCKQIIGAERLMGARFRRKQLDTLIAGVAEMFSTAAIKHRDEAFMNDIQKQQALKKPKTESEIRGELQEMGVTISEVPTNQRTHRTNP